MRHRPDVNLEGPRPLPKVRESGGAPQEAQIGGRLTERQVDALLTIVRDSDGANDKIDDLAKQFNVDTSIVASILRHHAKPKLIPCPEDKDLKLGMW